MVKYQMFAGMRTAAVLQDCGEPRKLHSVEIKSKRILILKTNKKQSDANW